MGETQRTQEIEDYSNRIIILFEAEQDKWRETIRERVAFFKEIYTVPDLMLVIYNDRQEAVERMNKLKNVLIKCKAKHAVLEKDTWFNAKHVERLGTLDDKKIYSKSELVLQIANIELVNNQITFFEQQIKTIDQIIYGINSRRDLEEYKRR